MIRINCKDVVPWINPKFKIRKFDLFGVLIMGSPGKLFSFIQEIFTYNLISKNAYHCLITGISCKTPNCKREPFNSTYFFFTYICIHM